MVNLAAIKLRRESLGLTMEEAAERAGMSGGRQRWNMLESGRRKHMSAETLYLIARGLRCTMDELMLPPKSKATTKK